MFKLFNRKKRAREIAYQEALQKKGTPEESLIEMAILIMHHDLQEGTMPFLIATQKEMLHIASQNEKLSDASVTIQDSVKYIVTHSNASRARDFITVHPEYPHVHEISLMTLLFTAQEPIGLVVNPNEEFVGITLPPSLLDLFRELIRKSFNLNEGDYYWMANGDWSIGKIIKVDERGVHLRVYRNQIDSYPNTLDIESLDYGKDEATGKYGVGHIPVSFDRFFAWGPTQVAKGEVTDEELGGYYSWRQAKGGYF